MEIKEKKKEFEREKEIRFWLKQGSFTLSLTQTWIQQLKTWQVFESGPGQKIRSGEFKNLPKRPIPESNNLISMKSNLSQVGKC